MTEKLFVYGSLKNGFPLHKIIAEDCRLIGYGRMKGLKLMRVQNGSFEFPGVVPGEIGDVVWGEVYGCNEVTLLHLDIIEGVEQKLFKRVMLENSLGGWWCYVINEDGPLWYVPHNKEIWSLEDSAQYNEDGI